MVARTAVAGGGNWTAAATWSPSGTPTAADDLFLNATSGPVTLDSGAVCRSLNCTGYTNTLTRTPGIDVTIGDATAGAGNVALLLSAGMTLVNNMGISFASTSATQQTITTNGKVLTTTAIQSGGNYILGDAYNNTAGATFALNSGTFNTGNFPMNIGLLAITGASAKTLTLGSSAIAITGSASNTVNYSGSNLTVTANTAVMTFSGATADFNGPTNWNGLSLVFTATNTTLARVQGSTVTVNNVTVTGPANKTSMLFFGSATAITGTLTVNGNSTVNRVFMNSGTAGTARTVTVGTAVSLSNVDFQDITAAGAAGTWTGTSMGNALGNTNITFDAPTTQTRTGAGGNWSTAGNWTSRVPLPQDNVVVGAGASGTITADMPRLGADIDFTGFTGTLSMTTGLTNYGSLVMASGMTISGAQNWNLSARSAKTLTSAGFTGWTAALVIAAPGGTYTLVGNFVSPTAPSGLTVSAGTLDAATNNVNVTVLNFNSAGAGATVNMGSGIWTMTRTGAITSFAVSAATTVSAANATIVISGATTSNRTFDGGGKIYGTLTYTVAGSTGSLTISGSNTFGTINFSDASNARSLLFTAGTTTTVTNWNVFGTAGKLMTVDSATAATHTLSKASGTVSSDYLSVANSIATGGAAWYAGANSTNGGGNTGWRFTVPGVGRRSLLGVGL